MTHKEYKDDLFVFHIRKEEKKKINPFPDTL